MDESVIQLRLKYIPIFRKVLSAKSAAMFFQLDRRVQMMIDLQLLSSLPLVQPCSSPAQRFAINNNAQLRLLATLLRRRLKSILAADGPLVTSQVPIDGADSDEVETVNYVSNIYKYYVAYKLIAVQKQQRQKVKEALENTTTPR